MSQHRYRGVDSYAASFVSFKAKVLIRTPHYTHDDLEDLEQELMLAYLLAWPGFDPDKGHSKSFIKAVINTGWQKHTIRSALSHALTKKHGYQIVSEKPENSVRIYKITGRAQ